ncbi:flagellar hook-length control protein FliK [Cohnella mopanensis]|uniref:flagellar hook-length control protein FliK n=1 Tax=Cohnella mopanensis TaxID=2911966 RepID=UPI001EF82DC0|nr:flagellar hook-length control protein FliK [Cohnella mopanensis]
MNMAISSTPISAGKGAVTVTGSATGSATGSGFAGALVQAIDGTSNTATVSNGLSMPVGLAGLLGQLGLDSDSEQSQDLLAMLANLVEQLEQLEQTDLNAIPTDTQSQLAEMLAAFQGLLQQLNPNQSLTGDQAESLTSTQPVLDDQQPLSSKPVVQALRETLLQLSEAIASSKDSVPMAANFAGQLKNLLDSVAAKVQSNQVASQATSKADSSEGVTTSVESNNAYTASANATKDSSTQTAVVIQEPRRTVQALRDPVWRFNVAVTTDAETASNQATSVTSVEGLGETNQSSSQPAWTFMQNDVNANSDATGKATLPAQVPVQQFATQMEKFLVKQFQLVQGNGTSEAKLSLTPEHLGKVDIRIIMQNGQLTAQFVTDNPAARELLENQMSQLRTALSGQGMQVERLEVVQQPASNASTTFMQQDQRHSNSGNGNGNNGGSKGESFDDPAGFAAELERNSSLKEFGYGSSINVTA